MVPNCVPGGNGANGGDRYNNGNTGASKSGGCAGGGGNGGAVIWTTRNNWWYWCASSAPGTMSTKDRSTKSPHCSTNNVELVDGSHSGGGGGYDRHQYTNGTNAGDKAWAQGGGGGASLLPRKWQFRCCAGAGQLWNDPSDPTNHNKFFGGGGGAIGATGPHR